MQKRILPAPGPAPVPPGVLLAMSSSIIHHRVPAFGALMAQARKRLARLFRTDREVLVFPAPPPRTWPRR
jgi:aspartate aminotransferase-like enzyme